MPINHKQQRTVKQQAWIEAMLTGENPTQAARTAKYAIGTEKHEGHKNTTKQHLMQEIDRRRAEMEVKSERTVQSIDQMQQAAYDLAMKNNQPSAAVSAGQAIARLYGMDKDSQANPDKPLPMTPDQLLEANRAAKVVLASQDAHQEQKTG